MTSGIPSKGWKEVELGTVLKRIRRPVELKSSSMYREIGIRSHGKGIFHKEERTGESIGGKSVFWVEPDCFVVNIVFAWEQAIAKTTASEKGMIASHRFPMFKTLQGKLDLDYLVYFFNSPRGKYLLGLASPGGAGRNKTLGQQEFFNLTMPLPPYDEQCKIVEILSTLDKSITLTEQLIFEKELFKKGLMQKFLSGNKQFPEFKGASWKQVLLEDVAIVIMGQSPASDFYNRDSNGLPLIQGNADIKNRRTSPRFFTSQITKKCEVGDLILSVRAPVGEIAKSIHSACIGRGVCAIRAKDIDDEFLYQSLLSAENKWNKVAQGSTFTAINSDDIKNFSIFVPTNKSEQKKIGSMFKLFDDELNLLLEKLNMLKQQKKGLMQKLLTGQIRVKV